MLMDLPGPPFQNAQKLLVVLPTQLAGLPEPDQHSLRNIPAIFQANQTALERELGVPFQLSESDTAGDEEGARWLIGPASCNPALAALCMTAQHRHLPV
jgi:hypothetical protein